MSVFRPILLLFLVLCSAMPVCGGTARPVLTGIEVNGQRIETGKKYDGRVLLTQPLTHTQVVRLACDENFVTILFAQPGQKAPARFRYRLTGVDKDWVRELFPAAGFASYTALPPGNYLFEVAADADGAPTAEVRLVVSPPWFLSAAALVVWLIVIRYAGLWLLRCFRRRSLPTAAHTAAAVMEPSAVVLPTAEEEFLKSALAVVEAHIGEAMFGVDELARALGMSRTMLYRKCGAAAHTTPAGFIRQVRVGRAAQLLRDSQLNVSEIACRTGFNVMRYFNKHFKAAYGMTPTAYRAANKGQDVKK